MLNRLIMMGLVLGLIVGLGAAATQSGALLAIAEISGFFGQLFINAIRMVIIPLVAAIIFSSLARLGTPGALGRLGGSALLYYAITLIPAIVIGMGVTSIMLGFSANTEMPVPPDVSVPEIRPISEFLLSLIPSNPIAAAANGALLPLIVFMGALAAAASTLDTPRRERMVQASEDVSAALIKLVWWVLWLAPIGVFGLIAPATANLGWGFVQALGLFIASIAMALLLFCAVVYAPLIWFLSKLSPLKFLRAIPGAMSIAFSTTSTAAAIPVSLKESTDGLKVSQAMAEFIIPFGASIYRPGSALFQGASIVFLAHLFDITLGIGTLVTLVFATLLVSLTVAPVPSASVMTMAPALSAAGIPTAGLGLLLGIDRIPDMMRSVVNLIGQISAGVVLDGDEARSAENLGRTVDQEI